jgi:signal recognition particle subunit SEC65
MATVMAMIIVNQFRGAIESHRKRRFEDHFVENEHRKRAAITEIQSTLLESDKFDNASSNSPSSPCTASLDPLPQNKLPQSDELKTSTDIKGTNECLTVKPEETPPYVSEAYSHFLSHVNESGELKGLKFIGVISGLTDDNDPYIWHHAENLNNNNNSTTHDEGNQKEFSYSVLRLDKFLRANEQLKNNQDKWISLILHISEMTEEEAEEIFGDEPVFQEVLQILKLDNLTLNKCQEYLHSEKIRRSEEESNRSEFEKGRRIAREIVEKVSDEIIRDISQKIKLQIKRRRNRNEAIVIKEIVGPIVDEHFDDQNFMKTDTEKHKSIIMDILKRHQSSIPYDAIDLRKKWPHENIEGFKEKISKTVENWLASLPKLAPENELAKEKLVQKTSIKSIEEYNSTVKPPGQLSCDFHQMGEIVNQQSIPSH